MLKYFDYLLRKTRLGSALFLLVFTATQVSCGFHLRGYDDSYAAPLRVLCIVKSDLSTTDFAKKLTRFLKAQHVRVVTDPRSAPFTLVLLSSQFDRAINSYDNVGQTTVYVMMYRVTYQILDRAGVVLVPPQSVTSSRTFSITSSQVNSDLTARVNLKRELEREMVFQLMNQLISSTVIQKLEASGAHDHPN